VDLLEKLYAQSENRGENALWSIGKWAAWLSGSNTLKQRGNDIGPQLRERVALLLE
jgi:hypothetical protein